MMKRTFAVALAALALIGSGVLVGQKTSNAPPTILHVITVRWTKDSTPQQRQAVLDGVKTMAAANHGIKTVWTKTLKVQSAGDDYNAAIGMEFLSQKAFEDYVTDPAHVAWKKLYDPIHDVSTTHDITN
jgi:hypothetical protein